MGYEGYTAEEAEGLQIRQLLDITPDVPVLLRYRDRALRGYVLGVNKEQKTCSFQVPGGPVMELPVRELWGIGRQR